MDYSDREVEEIWQRVKRYINPENIKAKSREDLASEIKKQMTLAGSSKNQGSMDQLVKNGFAERFSRLDDVKDTILVPTTPEARKDFFARKEATPKFVETDLPSSNIKLRKGNKISVKTGKGIRVFSRNTTNISRGTYGGKSAYYVYNTKLKKRISWGFIK